MAIVLHEMNEHHHEGNSDEGVEIDLVSWGNHNKTYPVKLTLVRRLNVEQHEPHLHELMFKNLYENLPIKALSLEIPHATNSLDYKVYTLHDVKVVNYEIYPPHEGNKKSYEKIIVAAKSKTPE